MKLHIEKTTEKDLKNIQQLWATPEVMKHVGFDQGYITDEKSMQRWYQQLIQNNTSSHFSIYHHQDYVGELFYRVLDDKAQLDIKLMPQFQGRGYGSYCLSWLIQYVFKHTECTGLYVDPNPDNLAALRLYHALGFKEVEIPHGYRSSELLLEVTWDEFKPATSFLESVVQLRPFRHRDLQRIWELSAKESHYSWSDLDAPYFEEYKQLSFREFMEDDAQYYLNNPRALVIVYDDLVIGRASHYWQDERTRWMNCGFDLYDAAFWSKGIGTVVLKQLITQAFVYYEIDRIGFVTWSGNIGMQRIGDKLGLKREGVIRRARYYKGVYYDSISYGITRSVWTLRNQDHYTIIEQATHEADVIEKEIHTAGPWCKPIIPLLPQHNLLTIYKETQLVGYLVYDLTYEQNVNVLDFNVLCSNQDFVVEMMMMDRVEQIAIRRQIPYIIIEKTLLKHNQDFRLIRFGNQSLWIKAIHQNESRSNKDVYNHTNQQ